MVDAALAYGRHGIPVLPVHTPGPDGGCSCGRAGCERPGKHPRLRHGLSEASTDPNTITRWWRRWPEANIGLCTGTVMDVADVDSAQGRHGLRQLLGGELPPGPQVRTGGGGWHFWFQPLGQGNRVRLLPGLDWRGTGGYVVAPPSRHASGARYRWVVRPRTGSPPVPAALAALIAPPVAALTPPSTTHPIRYAAAALAAETERVARAPVGARNDTLNRAAFALGRLVGGGLLDAATASRELTAAAAWAGLGRTETARTLRSGLDAGIRASPPPPGATPVRAADAGSAAQVLADPAGRAGGRGWDDTEVDSGVNGRAGDGGRAGSGRAEPGGKRAESGGGRMESGEPGRV